jgi:predicted amidohydrolase YtcJ
VAEVTEAAPDNPVYIQHLYDWLLLTPRAIEALNIREDSDVTPGGRLERDGDNRPTGIVIGNGNTLGKIFDKVPRPTLDQQVDGLKKILPRNEQFWRYRHCRWWRGEHVSRQLPGPVQAMA